MRKELCEAATDTKKSHLVKKPDGSFNLEVMILFTDS